MQREPLGGAAAWRGTELAQSDAWIRDLGADHVAELEAALASVRARDIDWQRMRREDFPLPGCGVT